jgi:phosphosulfolactate phosphohydrolase-like enzyme
MTDPRPIKQVGRSGQGASLKDKDTAPRSVRIDALPESALRYRDHDALVWIDILLAGSTVVASVSQGRRTFLTATTQDALAVARRLEGAVIVTDVATDGMEGILGGGGPALLEKIDPYRPVVVVSETARLFSAPLPTSRLYVASLQNLKATARYLSTCHRRVAVLAAGEDGEVRSEDQMAAAWLTEMLVRRGMAFGCHSTANTVSRWKDADTSIVGWTRSAERLRECGRKRDVDLVLSRRDNLDFVCEYRDAEIRCLRMAAISAAEAGERAASRPFA